MRKNIWMGICLFAASLALAQHAHDDGGCDCPSCRQKEAKTYTLPGLEGLSKPAPQPEVIEENKPDVHEGAELELHEGHDHGGQEVGSHDGHDHADHGGECGGHNHSEEGGCLSVSEEGLDAMALKLSAAQGGEISTSVVFPAEILLNRDRASAVSPRYASVIRQVFVEIGDEVKKGDVLASLENRETLSVYTVSAPLDGILVSKDASVGESANEDRVLFEVADLSSVWADISIFPKYQHWVKKGMAVEFVAHDGHTAHGVVKYVSPLISHETRTFTARCVLTGADEDFTPGAFVRAQITIQSAYVPVRVEREAVQTMGGQSVVFIQDEHGFESRDVQVGKSDSKFIEIKQGLQPGERYVSAGAFSLKAEMVTRGMDPHAGHGH